MELDVSKAFVTPAEAFPFEATVTFDPVELSGTYCMYEDNVIRLEGELHTVAHGECALCMQPAQEEVSVSFAETFRRDADELEGDSFRYEGKKLPLDHMTLTLAMLELPMRFECKDGCEGSAEPHSTPAPTFRRRHSISNSARRHLSCHPS